jgi:hypothetical protein
LPADHLHQGRGDDRVLHGGAACHQPPNLSEESFCSQLALALKPTRHGVLILVPSLDSRACAAHHEKVDQSLH